MNDFAAPSLKQRAKSGQKMVGIRTQLCSAIVAEALGFSGFDYVYTDMEEEPFGPLTLMSSFKTLSDAIAELMT
jgi:2-keto-3-deoxy-L-rhamnonate aldolase RhmA